MGSEVEEKAPWLGGGAKDGRDGIEDRFHLANTAILVPRANKPYPPLHCPGLVHSLVVGEGLQELGSGRCDVLADEEAFTASRPVGGGWGRSVQPLVTEDGKANLRRAELDDDDRRRCWLVVETRNVGVGGGQLDSLNLLDGFGKGGHRFQLTIFSGSSQDGHQDLVVDSLTQEFLCVGGLGFLVSNWKTRQFDGFHTLLLVTSISSRLHTDDFTLQSRQLSISFFAVGGECGINGVHL